MKDNSNGLEQPTGKFAIPVGQRPKLAGWEFYNKVLGAPKLVVSAHILDWDILLFIHAAERIYLFSFL